MHLYLSAAVSYGVSAINARVNTSKRHTDDKLRLKIVLSPRLVVVLFALRSEECNTREKGYLNNILRYIERTQSQLELFRASRVRE